MADSRQVALLPGSICGGLIDPIKPSGTNNIGDLQNGTSEATTVDCQTDAYGMAV